MASATLSPFFDPTTGRSFDLTSTGLEGSRYTLAGRELSCPFVVEVQRKLSGGTSTKNDHVILRIAQTERNASSGKLATMQVLLDISIPKDSTVITLALQKQVVALLASLLNEETAMEATNANISALIEGRDL